MRLTSRPDGESSPRWSPDGRYLAFLASRGTEDEKKLGAADLAPRPPGRRGAEADRDRRRRRATTAWSPDGKKFVFVERRARTRPTSPRRWKAGSGRPRRPSCIDRYHFKQDREGLSQALLHARLACSTWRRARLEQLTTGPVSATRRPPGRPTGRGSRSSARAGARIRTVIPNSRHLRGRGQGRAPRSEAVDAPTSAPTPAGPSWSPDGQWIAYSPGRRDPSTRPTDIRQAGRSSRRPAARPRS
ncbi:MAG: hypothetical protein M0C28_02135 [Candidatus Moduliflexus flocculans]|nr:hypothetical protein [Candidatus Moduliflexus flocculans]